MKGQGFCCFLTVINVAKLTIQVLQHIVKNCSSWLINASSSLLYAVTEICGSIKLDRRFTFPEQFRRGLITAAIFFFFPLVVGGFEIYLARDKVVAGSQGVAIFLKRQSNVDNNSRFVFV